MHIKVDSLSKRYGPQWIIRDFNFDFQSGTKYALKGSNGSGKSTLLQLCCTYLEPTKGKVQFITDNGKVVALDHIYKYFSFAAPYLSLVPHFSIEELLNFHDRMIGWQDDLSTDELLDILELKDHRTKYLQKLSSGMRQRVRLLLAMYAPSEALFLDEPTTNLDDQGKLWFQDQLAQVDDQKIVIIASNEAEDLQQCSVSIDVESYKK